MSAHERRSASCCSGSAAIRWASWTNSRSSACCWHSSDRASGCSSGLPPAAWADLYLRENPWHNRRRCSEDEWRDKALQQGMVAVNSILRDWVKGQIMVVETGLTEFRHVFLP